MNISELQQIGKEVYKDKPPAYQHKGDMELLEWHIKAMDRLTKAGRIHYIDSALTETEILSIGDIFTVKGYFTTSKDDFDNANQTKWIVEPLQQDKTKAHEIYRIYNHGDTCPYPE